MRHGSLFTGIGGFDLAARWMGWKNVLQCEIDPFCQQVLRHHFPEVTLYEDVRDINGNDWKGRIDLLSGGFPCQPFSGAGRKRGTADDRHLWPEMLRLVREIQPAWVVGENVRGLVSWNDGLVFEGVCADLEEAGYEVQPLCLPACAVGAPHRRERVWFVAHSDGVARPTPVLRDLLAHPSSPRRVHRADGRGSGGGRHWDAEPGVGRVADGVPDRMDRLRALGNAIVPQVAFRIFQAIDRASDRRS